MKHEIIDNVSVKKLLLGEMVRGRNQLGVSAMEWMERFHTYTVKLPVVWTRVTGIELPRSFSNRWAESHGEWDHGTRRTGVRSNHNALGMAYAWWSTHEHKRLEEFCLSDSPDFRAKCGGKTVSGDIGQCTPMALNQGLHMMIEPHSLWISVLDWDTQIILEFQYSVGLLITNTIDAAMSPDFDRERALRDVFWCEDCNEWAVPEESRKIFFRDWEDHVS